MSPPPHPVRGELELDGDAVDVRYADGRLQHIVLTGLEMRIRDAALDHRFVRHALVVTTAGRVDLVTPPEDGTIAPRAARLPSVPGESVIVAASVWETAVSWFQSGGRLVGYTVSDLARLACVATSQFALAIGEWAAQVALEMSWQRVGPLRGGGDLRQILRPLEQAARQSPRANEALVAALSMTAA